MGCPVAFLSATLSATEVVAYRSRIIFGPRQTISRIVSNCFRQMVEPKVGNWLEFARWRTDCRAALSASCRMENRADILRRRIALYRRYLAEGVDSDIARQARVRKENARRWGGSAGRCVPGKIEPG